MSDFDPINTGHSGWLATTLLRCKPSIAKQTKNLDAQTKALASLRTALTTFRSFNYGAELNLRQRAEKTRPP
ncbi:Uncharacterised protein [Kluyvera cryocrescens]|uniref:Uncharacterized protein n=1 Tax=Kluyvera cryocrescens TaxID=580 RepID=A0A485AM68_KLUCR|nr:Uncharacterised protein [Kluyvera cryocrescens]